MERLVEYLMIYSIRTALLALFSLCFSGSYLQQGYGSSMHSNLRRRCLLMRIVTPLVLGQPWKPFVMNVIVIFFGLIIFKICSPVCVCVSHDSVSFMSEFHEVLYPDMIGWVSGCGQFHIESSKFSPRRGVVNAR